MRWKGKRWRDRNLGRHTFRGEIKFSLGEKDMEERQADREGKKAE